MPTPVTTTPTHSARLRQMADQLEEVSAEDFLSANVSRFAPQVKIQVGYPAFLAKFGPLGAGPFAGDHIRYSTTVDGVEWMACRPMTDDEREHVAASLAVS